MAVITPQSDVYLLKVPLEINDINQLTFSNATAQYNYFSSLPKLTVNNFTYQRKDGTLRFPENFDDLISYNYVMYRNDAYSNKWFYAFITGMEYLNDNVTAVAIKTDVFQTWQFDLTYKRCFVEREHVNDDTVGLHTVPENLETGEYVLNGSIVNNNLFSSTSDSNLTWICFQVSDYPDGNGALSPSLGDDVRGKAIGGVYSGLTYLLVLSPSNANRLIKCYDLANKSDSIVAIFQVPYGSIKSDAITITNYDSPAGGIGIAELKEDTYTPINISTMTITKPTSLNSYTPVNNKLKTYPYCYFYLTNNAGNDTTYHYEDFSSDPSFNIDGVISQGMSIKAYPTNYKNGTNKDCYDFGLSCGKLPLCAWNSDYYTNWVTQNAVNIPMTITSSLLTTGLGMGASLLSANIGGVISSGINAFKEIGSVLDRTYQAKITPDQAKGNANCGDINIAENRLGYTADPMSIKSEYARICDEYFSMYGYKINRVKLPNITGRRNWNFVKTIGCYIEADIPQEDLQEIKDMFDKGITLWHNPATFVDYSQNNDII